jgi:hypothetical protein
VAAARPTTPPPDQVLSWSLAPLHARQRGTSSPGTTVSPHYGCHMWPGPGAQ